MTVPKLVFGVAGMMEYKRGFGKLGTPEKK